VPARPRCRSWPAVPAAQSGGLPVQTWGQIAGRGRTRVPRSPRSGAGRCQGGHPGWPRSGSGGGR